VQIPQKFGYGCRIRSDLQSRLTTMAQLLSFEKHQETRSFFLVRLLAQLLEPFPRALRVLLSNPELLVES
jgi:hypothetical protein